jgi:hypothetical protein
MSTLAEHQSAAWHAVDHLHAMGEWQLLADCPSPIT